MLLITLFTASSAAVSISFPHNAILLTVSASHIQTLSANPESGAPIPSTISIPTPHAVFHNSPRPFSKPLTIASIICGKLSTIACTIAGIACMMPINSRIEPSIIIGMFCVKKSMTAVIRSGNACNSCSMTSGRASTIAINA